MTRRTMILAATILLVATSATVPVFAQGAEQSVSLTEVEPLTLEKGYRSTRIVGSAVYNDAKQGIGKVDDLIITDKDTIPYAVLSVGGFLGIGEHRVVVLASSLEVVDGLITLHDGSKASLKALPSYAYTY